jgi:hypothetical protein
MRVTISHNRTKQDARLAVERSIDQLFTGLAIGPLELTDRKKHWSGDSLVFSLTAKMGFLKTPIHGSAAVSDTELTLDVDLGLLNKLIPEELAKNRIEGQVRGLLT